MKPNNPNATEWTWQTQLQHAPPIQIELDNWPLVPPIFQSVKYHNPDLESFYGQKKDPRFVYSRLSNPTVAHLENMLAQLQGCESGIALGSGMAAITCALFALLKQNDHVIYFAESYRPTRAVIKDFLSKFGVTSTMLVMNDVIRDPKVFERAIEKGRTRLVIFESPTNPTTRVAPFETICPIAKAHGVLTLLDGTLGGLHQNKDLGVDLYLQSLTKFAGGHGDVMGGAILGNKALIKAILPFNVYFGAVLDPNAAAMILRGMKTYAVRFREECKTALELAKRLEKHPNVVRVLYPGLESHPDYNRAKNIMTEFGSVFSFELKSSGEKQKDRSRVEKFVSYLEIANLAASLGSTETLIAPVRLLFAGDLDTEVLKHVFITETTMRVSVGLEDVEDLWDQWQHALCLLDA